jgi:hypothetical protein
VVGDPTNKVHKKSDTLYCFGTNFSNEYSIQDGGVNPYQSWTSEGQIEYENLKTMAKNGRENPNCKELEQWCLNKLRQQNNITASSRAEQRRKKRRKVVSTQEETQEQLDQMWDD